MASRRWEIGSSAQLVHAFALVLGLLSAFLLGVAVVAPLLGLGQGQLYSGSLAALFATVLIGAYAVGGVVAFGLFSWARVCPLSLGWRTAHLRRDLYLGLAAIPVLAACMVAVMWAFDLAPATLLETISQWTGPQRLQFLMIGVIAALGEESVFRGYLQPALCTRLGVFAGILATALIFTAYHLPISPHAPGLCTKFLFGLVLGGLRQYTGALVAPAIAHFGIWQLVGAA